MSSRRRVPALALIPLLASAPAVASHFATPSFEDLLQAPEAQPETIGTQRDIADRAAEMRALHARLAAVQVAEATRRPLTVELTVKEGVEPIHDVWWYPGPAPQALCNGEAVPLDPLGYNLYQARCAGTLTVR